jgi:hypothetical protein
MPPPATTKAAAMPAITVVPLPAPVSARSVLPPAGDGALLASGTAAALLLCAGLGGVVGVAEDAEEGCADGVAGAEAEGLEGSQVSSPTTVSGWMSSSTWSPALTWTR